MIVRCPRTAKSAALLVVLSPFWILHSAFAVTATRPFHLQLESNAAAAFPLIQRFGTARIDVYPAGFRVNTLWLRGFSRDPRRITIENSVSRTYVAKPMSEVGVIARTIGGHPISAAPPRSMHITAGSVGRLAARRFRLIYGEDDFIDVWTTSTLGSTPQFRAFVDEIVAAVSPASTGVLRSIPGTPLYVELNTGSYRKVAVLQVRAVVFNRTGESEALRVSPWMFPAPFGTIFK